MIDSEGAISAARSSACARGLVGAFPNGAPGDPEVYVGMLFEAVCAVEGLGLPALDAAVREIVATKKFFPRSRR